MKISRLTSTEADVVSRNQGLRMYLSNLEKGRVGTPHSWLYEHEDSQVTLSRWLDILKQLDGKSEKFTKIYQFDLKQVEKFGQMGAIPPISEAIHVEGFEEQYSLPDVQVGELRPLQEILHLQKHCVNLRQFDAVIDDMRARDTLVTNSGWDQFTRRDRVREMSIEQAKNGVAWTFPAIILFREYYGKLRAVWMFPMSMNLLEYQVTQPLQQIIGRRSSYVTPWRGFEYVKQRFTELWREFPYAFGGDTSAMDAHMRRPQNEAVATALSSLFSNPKQLHDTLLHVNDIDIVVGVNSIIRNQSHGIASGSGWTQLTETVFQMLKFDKYIRQNKLRQDVSAGMGIGDDYVWFFKDRPDSEDIVDFWEKDGLPGKVEKQSNEPDSCTFLQRLFLKGWFSRDDSAVLGGVYPSVRALDTLLWPEKFHRPEEWNSDMFCVRTFTILENVVDHPLFEQFVKFVVKGQKDLLPFARSSAAKQNSALRRSRLIPGLNPSYNQEKREKPLSEFSSIKYAASL